MCVLDLSWHAPFWDPWGLKCAQVIGTPGGKRLRPRWLYRLRWHGDSDATLWPRALPNTTGRARKVTAYSRFRSFGGSAHEEGVRDEPVFF